MKFTSHIQLIESIKSHTSAYIDALQVQQDGTVGKEALHRRILGYRLYHVMYHYTSGMLILHCFYTGNRTGVPHTSHPVRYRKDN